MNGRDAVNAQLITPASTPDSVNGDSKCITLTPINPYTSVLKQKWSGPIWNLVPYLIVVISFTQILTFMLADLYTSKLLRFDPLLRWEIWRYISYMLLHYSKTHLILNVVIQCLIATPLEIEQGILRTLAVYLGGGVFGALGACIFQPQPMVGASAGVYALLVSHLAHLYLNLNIIKYRKYRFFSVCVLAISDIAFCAFHSRTDGNPPISLGAHASGGLAGALFGLVVFKGSNHEEFKYKRYVKISAFTAILLLLLASIVAMFLLPTEFFLK